MNNFWNFWCPPAWRAPPNFVSTHFQNKRITYKTENFNTQADRETEWLGGGGSEGRRDAFAFLFPFPLRFSVRALSTWVRREATINIFHFPVARFFVSLLPLCFPLLLPSKFSCSSCCCCSYSFSAVTFVCFLAGYLWILIQVHVAEMKPKFPDADLHKPPPLPATPPTITSSASSVVAAAIFSSRAHFESNQSEISPCPFDARHAQPRKKSLAVSDSSSARSALRQQFRSRSLLPRPP